MIRREFSLAAGPAAPVRPRPDPPVSLPIVRPHPLPLRVLGIYENGIDYTSRTWREGDATFCRICPRDKCCFRTVVGVCDTCLVRDVDQFVPNSATGR